MANIQLVARGDVAVAFVQNDIVHSAFHGSEMFMDRAANRPQPVSNLRGMAITLHAGALRYYRERGSK